MSKQWSKRNKRNKYVNGHNNRGLRGIDHPAYRTGQNSRGGYIIVLVQEDHPFFSMATPSSSGSSFYIQEHRLIMAQHLGRALRPTEIVHHENEDKTDNRIENLRLFEDWGEHSTYHREKEWGPDGSRRQK